MVYTSDLLVNYSGFSEVAFCVYSHSECRHAALENEGKRRKQRCWRGVRGVQGMWVESREILRMTLLKLNMSDSNTITIKRKALEIQAYPQTLVCSHSKTYIQIALVKWKLLREPSVRSCTEKAAWSYWFDRTRHSLHTVPYNETTALELLAEFAVWWIPIHVRNKQWLEPRI